MNKVVILFISLFLFACQSKEQRLLDQIEKMKLSETVGTPEHSAKMAELHTQYGLLKEDSLANAYLYAAGVYYFYEDQRSLSDSLLNILLQRPVEENRWRNAQVLMGIMQAEKEDCEAMQEHFKLAVKIGGLTNSQWNEVVQAYEQCHRSNEPNTLGLYHVASGLRNMGQFDKSLSTLDRAIALDTADALRPNMIYEAGFLAWDVLQDGDKATAYYELFLKDYPEHPQAAEVRQILDQGMLGMSDKEILDMIKAKAAGTYP